ncbi:MAG TPA: glycosyltransferase family 39 protein [Anaerolineales bacterium]|nr:glycosyltransferase family 39 protein [Anaerolineales bacterium]
MSSFNAIHAQKILDKFISALRVSFARVQLSAPVRLILLLTGIASIGYGQYLMEQRWSQSDPIPAAELWNSLYRLEIDNYNNVYLALPYFAGGAFLCALIVMPLSWKNPFTNWTIPFLPRESADWKSIDVVVGIACMSFLLIQLGKHLYTPIYLVIWLISICAFARIFLKWDRSIQSDLSLGISYLDLFWIAGLLLLGFSVGSFALQDVPIAVIPDEDPFWQTAYAIALNHQDLAFFDTGVFTFPAASSIFQSWILRMFGANLWAWRFSSVIAGVSVIVPLYLLTKEWFGRSVAVVTCILMVANPYFLAFSRLGYNNSQSLFPVTLCIYFFALAARKGSYFYLWLSGLAAGLGFYTYFATWLSLVVLGTSILYLWFLKEISLKHSLTALGVILFGWGVAFVPRILYGLSGTQRELLVYKIFETVFFNAYYGRVYYGEADLINTLPLIHIGEQHRLFFDPVIYGELMYRGMVRTFLAMFNPYVVSNHFLVTGLAGVITPVFFLIGIVVCLRYGKQLRFGLPALWLLGGMIFLSAISAFPPSQTHFVSTIPALALVSGAGLVAVTDRLTELLFSHRAFLQTMARNALLTMTAFAILYSGYQRYFVTMPVIYRPSFENIALWMMRRTERPVNFVYLGSARKAHRIVQLLHTSDVSHPYRSATIDQFVPGDETIYAPTIIFIESQGTEDIPLLQKPPPGYRQIAVYHGAGGEIIGYAMTNTSYDLEPDSGFGEGIRSLVERPVRYILAALIVMLVLFGFLALRDTSGTRADRRNLL